MRMFILLLLLAFSCGGTAWAAQARDLSPSSSAFAGSHSPVVYSPVPPAVPYMPVGSVNLTEVWLQSPAARMYWNGVGRPTQINLGIGAFRDPALVPLLLPEKSKARQARRGSRGGASRAALVKCNCMVPVKCTCVISGGKCSCVAAGQAAAKPAKPAAGGGQAALTPPPGEEAGAAPRPTPPATGEAPTPAPLSAPAPKAAAVPALPLPAPVQAAAGSRAPSIPKAPTPLQ